jgi:hypothetical protein
MWKKHATVLAACLAVCGWLSTATGDDPVAAPDTPVQSDGREPAAEPPMGGDAVPGMGMAPGGGVDGVPGFIGQLPAAQDNEMPRRVARDFAPWIAALVQEKWNNATAIYPIRREAQEYLDLPNARRIFRKFGKTNGLDLALIGGRGLGDQTGVLLFTVTTESGPVAFKVYHYRFGNTRSVGKIEITDDWADLEKMYLTVDPLHSPVLVPL